jgi:antitoxin (DNA-binding transcriptional repressor) of toxin-antitoxin stability system
MADVEIGIEAARPILGELADAASQGQTTYLTRHGRRIAAIIRIEEPMDTTQQTAVWSVVRGESPTAHAADPGLAGVDIPGEVLTWAGGHGLDVADPDVYILVAPQDEAGEVRGEIACMTLPMPGEDMARVRAELASSGA